MGHTRGSQYLWAPSALSEEEETQHEWNISFPPSSIDRYLKYSSEVQKPHRINFPQFLQYPPMTTVRSLPVS